MALSEAAAARLAQLEAARDNLISGRAVSKISAHGRSKDMAPADLKRLDGEIEALRAQASSGARRRRGALTFRFGR